MEHNMLNIRPYQIMCAVCKMGRKGENPYYFEERLDEILHAIRANRIIPLSLSCNVNGTYSFQNPGAEYDTPEGRLFNIRRDLALLHKLGTIPGINQPAADIFRKLDENVKSVSDICGFDCETSKEWQGCKFARTGNYERGLELIEKDIIVPRDVAEIETARKNSIKEMYEADELKIRPHHLLCMACFHDGRNREQLAHIDADNLYEAVDICQKKPDIPIRLVEGPCMICASCASYDHVKNVCHGSIAMNLRDEKKDLDVLQMLGLKYGDVLPARELYRRLFEKINSTTQVCGNKDGITRAAEWRICGGADGNCAYVKARTINIGIEK